MRRLLIAFLLAWAAPVPLAAQGLPVTPARSSLTIPVAGVAVIRDVRQWQVLWDRFGRRGQDGRPVAAPPPADFRSEMLIVAATGPQTGCNDDLGIIGRVEERGDTLVVRPPPPLHLPSDSLYVTCMALVHPTQVVRVPRSRKPVVFESVFPPPARWWDTPSWTELQRGPASERKELTLALARDPRTPAATIRALVAGAPLDDWMLTGLLMAREDVRQDPALVATLARLGGAAGSAAREVLVERHALRVARDRSTPPELIRILLQEMWNRRSAERPVVAALLRNPRVRADRELLEQLLHLVYNHQGEMLAQGCALYMSRREGWERNGNRTDSGYAGAPCGDTMPRKP